MSQSTLYSTLTFSWEFARYPYAFHHRGQALSAYPAANLTKDLLYSGIIFAHLGDSYLYLHSSLTPRFRLHTRVPDQGSGQYRILNYRLFHISHRFRRVSSASLTDQWPRQLVAVYFCLHKSLILGCNTFRSASWVRAIYFFL